MQVELDRSLLQTPEPEDLLVLALCAHGLVLRHRVFPDSRADWEPWRAKLPRELSEQVKVAWDESEQRATLGARSEVLRVVAAQPDRNASPARLTARDALSLLGRPLRVILENGRNDRAFVLAFADPATRSELLAAERAGWLVFETAGGITEMVARAADGTVDAHAARVMYLCDSDATTPGQPSADAARMATAFADWERTHRRRPHHFGRVLSRRAAENYAPPGAVLTWAVHRHGRDAGPLVHTATTKDGRRTLTLGCGNPGSSRRHVLGAVALRELPASLRAVIDMKHGRGADGRRTADDCWNNLDAFQQAALRDGFGPTFSAIFYPEQRHLPDETGEITAFLAKLLERL